MADRDDFGKVPLNRLANRAGHRCSNPDCRRPTSGPESTTDGSVNIGVAAHITAASVGGPRFDPYLTPAQRSAVANGIWLCQSCAKLIDNDTTRFTQALLLEWKSSAEQRARLQLETPERPEGAGEPELVLPSTDAKVSWLLFSARATTLVGRDDERAQLDRFLCADRRFLWWLLSGPAGAGKSRLALEICRDSRPQWAAGFLSRVDIFTRWSHFRPSRPTLIVVDYVASRVASASGMVLELCRSQTYLPFPVRVLLVEREQGSWWSQFLREESQSEYAELIACQYADPLYLGHLAREALRTLAAEVAHRNQIPWNEPRAQAFELRMRTLDPLGRPLFGMMAAAYSKTTVETVIDSTLLRSVLKKESARRRALSDDREQLRRLENLLTLATLVGGLLPESGSFAFLAKSDVGPLLPDTALLDRSVYREMAAATTSEATLSGLQPDILGERFVLDRLANAGVDDGVKRLVKAAWAFQPNDFCDFVARAASDFPTDTALDSLCDVPLETGAQRARWGRLVADLVRVANRSADLQAGKLLGTLRELANRYSHEGELQHELARAELYLGNIFLFSEGDHARAAEQFDTAISRAGAGSDIAASAINNRGILYNVAQNEDRAFADWSDVIANTGVSDEARACSLNNRADIFARRGAHDDAIRDRSAVLALKETSPDRRYIALIRRSLSYARLGRSEDALRDLGRILEIDDIAPEQKTEARMTRGVLLRDIGRLADARVDLEAVLVVDVLFPGMFPETLVELGELARLEHDIPGAREYLRRALASTDIEASTVVDTLILNARLARDEGDLAQAESIWQVVLANPNANDQQRAIATNRDTTITT